MNVGKLFTYTHMCLYRQAYNLISAGASLNEAPFLVVTLNLKYTF